MKGSLIAFVVSLNLHRRHLTSSQAAAASVEVLPMLEEEAKDRQRANALVNQPQNKNGQNREIFPYSSEETGKSTDQAAALFQTNGRYVSDAKKLNKEAPDLFEKVKTGEMTIPQARREKTKRSHFDSSPLSCRANFNVKAF